GNDPRSGGRWALPCTPPPFRAIGRWCSFSAKPPLTGCAAISVDGKGRQACPRQALRLHAGLFRRQQQGQTSDRARAGFVRRAVNDKENNMLGKSLIGALATLAALWFAIDAAAAFDDSKYPNLKGQWVRARIPVPGGGQAPFDPTKPVGRGQQAP